MSDFEIKAGKMLEKYSGEDMGITQIKYLTTVLTFCKKMDKEFKLPMPPKEISKDWDINDWCQYVDATWAERVKKDEESKELPF